MTFFNSLLVEKVRNATAPPPVQRSDNNS